VMRFTAAAHDNDSWNSCDVELVLEFCNIGRHEGKVEPRAKMHSQTAHEDARFSFGREHQHLQQVNRVGCKAVHLSRRLGLGQSQWNMKALQHMEIIAGSTRAQHAQSCSCMHLSMHTWLTPTLRDSSRQGRLLGLQYPVRPLYACGDVSRGILGLRHTHQGQDFGVRNAERIEPSVVATLPHNRGVNNYDTAMTEPMLPEP
jgi:hypothetical protein